MVADRIMLALETSGLRGSVALARGGELVAFRWLAAERTHTSELMPIVQELLAEIGVRAADVGVYAYSSGPGSFTGLRIAATVGRMLQSATGCGVVAVSTLEVIARNALRHPDEPQRVAAILDAKRGQVYGAVFENQSPTPGRDGAPGTYQSPSRRAGGLGPVLGARGSDGRAEVPTPGRDGAPAGRLRTAVEAGIYDPVSWLAGIARPLAILGDGVARHREACAGCGGQILDPEYWPPSAEHVAEVGTRLAAEGRFCQPEEIVPLYLRPPECEEVYETRRAAARRRRGE